MEAEASNYHREKRTSRKAILEKKKAIENAIRAATSVKDQFSYFPHFRHYRKNGLFLHLEAGCGNRLSLGTKKYMKNLLKLNMEAHYGPEWPAEEKIKRREMVAEEARYIFLHDVSNGDGNETFEMMENEHTCCKGPIVGFVHYRFILEEEVPVVYVYELQIEPHLQGKGLGKFLMQLIELITCKNRMGAVVLTVQRSNTSAMNFYIDKLGYTISAISPSRIHPSVAHYVFGLEKSYEILCKTFDHEAQAVLEAQTQSLSRTNH